MILLNIAIIADNAPQGFGLPKVEQTEPAIWRLQMPDARKASFPFWGKDSIADLLAGIAPKNS